MFYAHPHSTQNIDSQNIDSMTGLSQSVDSMRGLLSYQRGEQIYGDNDRSDHLYCLISGAARKYALLADGRRRIIDFLLPGDFFGFRGPHRQFFAVEAVSKGTSVSRYPRPLLETTADADPRVGRKIRELAFQALWRSQARLLILGRVTSIAKVGAFLMEMAQRSFDSRDQTVVLPMSRYDIADYLALSVETVSRALTELKRCHVIVFVGTHRLRLIDCGILEKGFERRSSHKGATDAAQIRQTREDRRRWSDQGELPCPTQN
jgi:CRP-like cAMP-binding protein